MSETCIAVKIPKNKDQVQSSCSIRIYQQNKDICGAELEKTSYKIKQHYLAEFN